MSVIIGLVNKVMLNFPLGQEERLEELRDIHHMEAKSQTDLIDKLRKQLEDGQASMKASQDSTAKVEEEFAKRKAEVERAQTDAEKARTAAKEEEEKRTKAISLLKTVRQKLVKTEKERDDALKDAGAGRDKEREEREKEKAERARLQAEIDKVNSERDKAIMGMKAHFDREIANTKDRHEKEMAALKGQFEIEAAAAKVLNVIMTQFFEYLLTSVVHRRPTLRNFLERMCEYPRLKSPSRTLLRRRTDYSNSCRSGRLSLSPRKRTSRPSKARQPSSITSCAKPGSAMHLFSMNLPRRGVR